MTADLPHRIQHLVSYWLNVRSHGDSNPTKKSATVLLGKRKDTKISVNIAGQEMQQQKTCKELKSVNKLQICLHTVVLHAILLALKWVAQIKPNKVLVRSDSVSALSSLMTSASKNRQDLLFKNNGSTFTAGH